MTLLFIRVGALHYTRWFVIFNVHPYIETHMYVCFHLRLKFEGTQDSIIMSSSSQGPFKGWTWVKLSCVCVSFLLYVYLFFCLLWPTCIVKSIGYARWKFQPTRSIVLKLTCWTKTSTSKNLLSSLTHAGVFDLEGCSSFLNYPARSLQEHDIR